MKVIPYGHQFIDDKDIRAVLKVLRSDYLTTGPKVEEFEKALSSYVGANYVVAVNSGTSALDIAVGALGLPAGSEIITTPFTFVASSNCILYNNCRPVFADINPRTYNIDPGQIRKKITKRTKAIIYVDYAGQPCDIQELREIAKEHDLYLIEDACHALGAKYRGKRVGSFADMTVFSFHPVKHITTGEGGAVTTDNKEFYGKLRLLRNHGIDKTPSERSGYLYDMKMLGRNYRLTDFQCALGISQLKKLPTFLKRRAEIAKIYNQELGGVNEIELPYVCPYVKHARHLYTVLAQPRKRDFIFAKMKKGGIGVNVHYIPIYRFSYYKKFGVAASSYPVTEEVYSRTLSIPLHYAMSDEDVVTVVKCLKKSIEW